MPESKVRKLVAATVLGGSLLAGPLAATSFAQEPSPSPEPSPDPGTTTGGTTGGTTTGGTTSGVGPTALAETGGDLTVLVLGGGAAVAAALGARRLGRQD